MHTDRYVGVPYIRVAEAFFRFLIVAGVLGFGLSFAKEHLMPEVKTIVSNDDITAVLKVDDEEALGELLEAANKGQLIEILESYEIDPNLEIDARKLEINNLIRVAARASKSRILSRKISGLTYELELRRQQSLINLSNGIIDNEANDEMMDLANLYKTIQFEESSAALNEKAKLAEITGLVSDFIENGTDEDEPKFIIDLTNKLGSISENLVLNSPLANSLVELAGLAQQRLEVANRSTKAPEEIQLLLEGLHNESRVKRFEKLVALECDTLNASRLNYMPNHKDNAQSDPFVVKLKRAINDALAVGDLGEDEYQIMLEKFEQATESGWLLPAQQMLMSARQKFDTADLSDEISQRSLVLENRLKLTGEKVSLDGIVDLKNQPAKFESPMAYMNIILFVAFENKAKSDRRLNQVIQLCEKAKVSIQKVNLAVVVVHDNDKMNALTPVEQLANRLPMLSWWQLNINSPDYPNFKNLVGIETAPFVLILDESRRVAAIDPKGIEIQSLFTKLDPLKMDSQ